MTSVSYRLAIGGEDAPQAVMDALVRIDVELATELAALMRIRFLVGAAADGGGWSILDDDHFPRLTRLDLTVDPGSGSAEHLLEAYVVETQARLGAPGHSFLDVIALDPSVLMSLEERVHPWPDMADSDVARTIFSNHGLTPKVTDTGRTRAEAEVITMQRGTDLALLRGLAARNGYELAVDTDPEGGPSVGYFGPPRTDDPPQGTLNVAFAAETNVDEFEARYDMLRATEAVARGMDTASGDSDPLKSQEADRKELGPTTLLDPNRPRRVLLSGSGLSDAGDLQALAQATVDRSTWAIVAEGKLTTVAYQGLLRPRLPVMVRGAGRTFSGRYYAERVLHSLSGGHYEQRFTLRRNALGLTGSEDFVDDGAVAPLD